MSRAEYWPMSKHLDGGYRTQKNHLEVIGSPKQHLEVAGSPKQHLEVAGSPKKEKLCEYCKHGCTHRHHGGGRRKAKKLRKPRKRRSKRGGGHSKKERNAKKGPFAKRQAMTVYGFVKENYTKSKLPRKVLGIIYRYYRNRLDSHILNISEQRSLLNLIFKQMTSIPPADIINGNIKEGVTPKTVNCINTVLLYRASEHGFTTDSFHKHCDRKGATITIIQNEKDHVFGGYSKKSWSRKGKKRKDPTAFLFAVRPKLDTFMLKTGEERGEGAVWCYDEWGPLYGNGNDIWICNRCDIIKGSGCSAISFDWDVEETVGEAEWDMFKVNDYEVFAINIS